MSFPTVFQPGTVQILVFSGNSTDRPHASTADFPTPSGRWVLKRPVIEQECCPDKGSWETLPEIVVN
jgi:hypothetical protein